MVFLVSTMFGRHPRGLRLSYNRTTPFTRHNPLGSNSRSTSTRSCKTWYKRKHHSAKEMSILWCSALEHSRFAILVIPSQFISYQGMQQSIHRSLRWSSGLPRLLLAFMPWDQISVWRFISQMTPTVENAYYSVGRQIRRVSTREEMLIPLRDNKARHVP